MTFDDLKELDPKYGDDPGRPEVGQPIPGTDTDHVVLKVKLIDTQAIVEAVLARKDITDPAGTVLFSEHASRPGAQWAIVVSGETCDDNKVI